MDLTEFLLARIAEDEAVARGAIAHGEGALDWADEGDPTDTHIARHDPARILAECEAKRRILAIHAPAADGRCGACSDTFCVTPWDGLCEIAKPLALPYADHPDYREEWKP